MPELNVFHFTLPQPPVSLFYLLPLSLFLANADGYSKGFNSKCYH